ncbi:MAG: cyclase family protein, partial [Thermodesulfobacteriota bacterium]
MKKFVELNHPLEDGMKAYPGFPNPKIESFFDHQTSQSHYDYKAEFYIGKVEMVCNVGTYIDSPFHRYPEGVDLSQIPLIRVAGLPGIVLDAEVSSTRSITLDCSESELHGQAVLFRTGWDQQWGKDSYWEPGPYLSDEVIDLLIRSKAALV